MVALWKTEMAMDKLIFNVDRSIFENISSGAQKAFVAQVKPSELNKYFILNEEKKIDVRYFNEIEFTHENSHCSFKIGYAEIDFLIPNQLLDSGIEDLTEYYNYENMPPVEIMFQLKERLN